MSSPSSPFIPSPSEALVLSAIQFVRADFCGIGRELAKGKQVSPVLIRQMHSRCITALQGLLGDADLIGILSAASLERVSEALKDFENKVASSDNPFTRAADAALNPIRTLEFRNAHQQPAIQPTPQPTPQPAPQPLTDDISGDDDKDNKEEEVEQKKPNVAASAPATKKRESPTGLDSSKRARTDRLLPLPTVTRVLRQRKVTRPAVVDGPRPRRTCTKTARAVTRDDYDDDNDDDYDDDDDSSGSSSGSGSVSIFTPTPSQSSSAPCDDYSE
ncbi:MAG: hypothetical protein IV100_28840 [Myxococcales bacterium]|nr:hypothetical protein [Myxococcales bacterium]